MGIDRPDWTGTGGDDSAATVPAVTEKNYSGLENWDFDRTGNEVVETESAPKTPAKSKVHWTEKTERKDWNYNRTGNEVDPNGIAAGLDRELVREMASSPDALERNLAELRETASAFLDTVPDRNTFVAAFDMFSPGLQRKAFQTLRANPRADLADLLDKIEPLLTLNEMVEAERFVRSLRRERARGAPLPVGLGFFHHRLSPRSCHRH
jgi:hypothetical protein